MKTMEFQTEEVQLSQLKDHPRNYQEHPDDQLEHIMQSIKEHGVYRNVVIAKENTILAGHGVVKGARKLGLETIPVIRLDLDPNDPRALKVLIGDNEISHLSERDDRSLTNMLKEIYDFDTTELLGTGYDEMMLANLTYITRPVDEIATLDEAAEWVGLPEYEANSESSIKVIVTFRNESDRELFFQRLNNPTILAKNYDTWSCWWPSKEPEDTTSVKFQEVL